MLIPNKFAIAAIIICLSGPALADGITNPSGSSSSAITSGSTPLTCTSGTAGVLFQSSGTVACDSGFTYAGSGGQVLASFGTQAAPGYSFVGRPTLGMLSTSSSALLISAGSNVSGAFAQFNTTGSMSIGLGGVGNEFVMGTNGFISMGNGLTIGSTTSLTLTAGELGMNKGTAASPGATITITAPGAAGAAFIVGCGTNAGSAAVYVGAGTSTTATRLLDNIGSGVTGC